MPADELFRTLRALLEADVPRHHHHALAVLDVDALTEINCSLGRAAGDRVLASVSSALALTLEPRESAAWWAGDQYVVLFPGVGRRKALRRTRRIVAGVATFSFANGVPASVSAGVAIAPVDGTTNSALIEAAAAGLRRAKLEGHRAPSGLAGERRPSSR